MNLNIKQLVEQLDIKEVLEDYLGVKIERQSGHDYIIQCPYSHNHSDSTPSCAVHSESGVFNCFGCGEAGHLIQLCSFLKKEMYQDVYKELTDLYVSPNLPPAGTTEQPTSAPNNKPVVSSLPPPNIDETKIQLWHNELMQRRPIEKFYWTEDLGVAEGTLRAFDIGWDGKRYTIPIRDQYGEVRNVRRYLPGDAQKVKNYGDGSAAKYGSPIRLWPDIVIDEYESFFIVEGEKDCIVANDRGFPAITTTGGSGYWNPEWSERFAGKTIYVCYDSDAAGRKGAQKVADNLAHVAEVFIIDLPEPEGSDGFDLTDFFTTFGGHVVDMQSLMDEARLISPPMTLAPGEEEPAVVSLGMASHARYNGKPIQTNVIVSGKDTAPYILPLKVRINCSCGNPDNACPRCPVYRGMPEEHEITPRNSDILKLINCSDMQQKGYVREIVGLPKKCPYGKLEYVESGNIQQIVCIPEIEEHNTMYGSDEHEYVSRNAYYLGHTIVANRSYKMKGYTYPDPKTQHATHIFDHKDDMQDSVRSFEMTPLIRSQLEETFSLSAGETIQEKLDDIYNYFSRDVHHIRGRPEIQLAFDLVWHSALHFDFMGQYVRKGWLEGLIIGDSAQSKTSVATGLRDYYNLGARITGEKTTAAGLVGGLQQLNGRWILQWGAYPQNDRRAMIIDEFGSMSLEDIGNMTDLRSTGIAEIIKIRMERTNARVRVLFLANARSGEPLKQYTQGIIAIQELMGKSEDIRRLDFALTVASGEVDPQELNKPKNSIPIPKKNYSREMCRKLILWAWSRNTKPGQKQVQFSEQAEKAILEHAISMGKKYHPNIPLVEPSDQRLKLARMSIALAIRLFSTDETGEIVYVTREHVEYIVQWLESQYDKPSMSYDAWSEQQWRATQFDAATEKLVIDYLRGLPDSEEIITYLSTRSKPFRVQDLENSCGLDRETTKDIIKALMKYSALESAPSGFRSQPNLNVLLQKMKRGLV